MLKLTARQEQILNLIKEAIDNTGFPPTRAEIASELGFRSANAAEEHLQALARKGAIEISPGTSRGIRLIGASVTPPAVPVWGYPTRAPCQNRTDDLFLTMETLCRLS